MSSIAVASSDSNTHSRRGQHYPRRRRLAEEMGQYLLPISCSLLRSLDAMPALDFYDESEVEWLHIFLLKVSLRHLRDGRVGRSEREDCFRWVFGEDDAPFSFAACCHSAGYDPATLRDHVRRTLLKGTKTFKGDTDARTTCDAGIPGILSQTAGSLPAIDGNSVREQAGTDHGLR